MNVITTPTTPSLIDTTIPHFGHLDLAAEAFPSPVSELSPDIDIKNHDRPHTKNQSQRKVVTSNACTECRRRRSKCDGNFPCDSCSRHFTLHPANMCVYLVSSRLAKKELQSENGELRRQKAISDRIFDALRSGWQVSKILQLLTDQESLALIAKIAADAPPIECSTGSSLTGSSLAGSPLAGSSLAGSSIGTPSQVSSATDEELFIQKYKIEDSFQSQTEATAQTCPWTATAHDEILTRHLFSVYWTFLHPSYRLFSMEQFLQGYETGDQEHCTPFLVAAVCAAACTLLNSRLPGQVPDVTTLRRDFIAEATFQEVLADRSARTWLEASRVMLIVHGRAEVSRQVGLAPDGEG